MQPPEKIGRYEIERELGRGGMAVVYLARDPLMNRQVAVKLLPQRLTFEEQFKKRFEREAEIIASLEHPAIVPVYDYGDSEGQPFIVMRYMPGGALADRLNQGPITPEEGIRVLEQLALGLDKAHRMGVIHRDLKPGNILFDEDGRAYTSDFGIAKITESSIALTGSGIVGTPAYMSPEQAMGKKTLDGRSDVYALGIILFEMLTGKLPFEANTPMSVALAHITDPVPNILETRPGLSPIYKPLVERALAKEREDRFGSASELVAALNAVEEGASDFDAMLQSISRPIHISHAPRVQSPTPAPQPVPAPLPAPAAAKPARKKPPKMFLWGAGVIGLGCLVGFVVLAVLVLGFGGMDLFGNSQGAPEPAPEAGGVSEEIEAPTPPPALEPTPADVQDPTETPALPPLPTETPSPTEAPLPTETPPSTQTPLPTPTPAPTSTPDAFSHLVSPDYVDDFGVRMVFVPGGTFTMGSESGDDDETPVLRIIVDDFYVDQFEVTNAQYEACVTAGWCSDPALSSSYSADWYFRNPVYDDYPVVFVTWFDAQSYCNWRGIRLPTEAEWEKAARGTDARVYPWGNAFQGNASNFCDVNCSLSYANVAYNDGYLDTAPIGSYPSGVSPYGVYDMGGNVWEWVADWYDSEYYESLDDGSRNPAGPSSGEERVIRGGSWNANSYGVRTSYRYKTAPDEVLHSFGFRCVWSP